MKRTLVGLMMIGLALPAVAEAQGRGRNKQGIPPGHMPAAGECRVWYDGVPPGRQPAPTDCDNAERIASRDRNARVIYGNNARRQRDNSGTNGGLWDVIRGDRRGEDRDGRYDPTGGREQYPADVKDPEGRKDRDARGTIGRAVPRTGDGRYASTGNDNGYRDGLTKGREDINDGDKYDPNRHSWYRSADRGYNSRYGSRDDYRGDYRNGFLRGYEEAYNGRTTPWGRR